MSDEEIVAEYFAMAAAEGVAISAKGKHSNNLLISHVTSCMF